MKLAKNREAGQILVWALIRLALGPLLIVPMLQLSSSSQKYNQITEIYTLNTYVADSGIEYGRYQVYNNAAEIQATPLQKHLVIDGVDVYLTAEYVPAMATYDITSAATKASKSLTIDCMIVIDVGLFGNVVACDGDLTVDHCDFISDVLGEADIYTHGDIRLIHSYIDGDVKATGIVDNDHSTITGETIVGAEVLEFSPMDAEINEEKAKLGGTSGTISWNNKGTKELGPLYIDGNLTVIKTNVILGGTVYVTGNVHIDHASLTGFGDMLAEGDLHIDHYSLTVGDIDILPLFMSVYEDISIDRDSDTYAILYAPQGRISLDHVDVFGSVAAPDIYLNQARINYPAEMRGRADLPGAGLDTVTYLFE